MKLLKGIGTSSYIGVGKVRKIEKEADIPKIQRGEIVVVSKASRDMLLYLQTAGGVITDYGGITSHVAIVKGNENSMYCGNYECNRKT